MLGPKNWLEKYVDININAYELRDRMTMSGSNVEDIRNLSKNFEGVVVGRIEKVEPHENADKLVIVTVNIGKKNLQIVTGATNFKENNYVPVAIEGARLAEGLVIEKGELRGAISEGMMCSHDELGISKSLIPENMKEGLWIMEGKHEPGMPFEEALKLNDEILEFEITPNRPDCLNMIGLAREISATLKTDLHYPQIKLQEAKEKTGEDVSIRIDDPKGCHRYIARVLKGVKVQPSPDWLQVLLMKAGIRPINNIVDATNYVMLEYGQPIHAFDLGKIPSKKIVVKKAGETKIFKTLDGVERKIQQDTTLITDGTKPLAIAGVMGGLDSEVDENTVDVLLESANFEADRIRETSKYMNLRTEASSRYEKGVDKEVALTAINRVSQMIQGLTNCTVLKGVIDEYAAPFVATPIDLRIRKVNQLLGTKCSPDEIIEILESLEIKVVNKGDILTVTPPSFRSDLIKEVDYIEEVARIFGYDRIPSTMPEATITVGGINLSTKVENLLKVALKAQGLYEVLTYSFVSPKSISKIGIPKGRPLQDTIQLLNPLGEETSAMRTTLMPSMMDVLERNYKKGNAKMKAFEIGRTFWKNPEGKMPFEKSKLVIGMYGEEEDFYRIKGTIEEMLKGLKINKLDFEKELYHSTFHPGRCANVYTQGVLLGTFGEVHPKVTVNYGIEDRCYLAELDFEVILNQSELEKKYQPLPKYPSILRDIAIVVPDHIEIAAIEKIFESYTEGILESYELFDIYQGDQIDKGSKSIAYSLIYRDFTKTLKEKEVNKIHEQVLKDLEEKVGASLR